MLSLSLCVSTLDRWALDELKPGVRAFIMAKFRSTGNHVLVTAAPVITFCHRTESQSNLAASLAAITTGSQSGDKGGA